MGMSMSRSVMDTVTIYSAMRENSNYFNHMYEQQNKGELAGGGSYGIYFTTVYEQAESWAKQNGYNYICQAELPLDWYSGLDSLVFAPNEEPFKSGPFQQELMTLNATKDNAIPGKKYFTYTCNELHSFKEFFNSNMTGDVWYGRIPVIKNYPDEEDQDEDEIPNIHPSNIHVFEASIMCGPMGQQMFFTDFSRLHGQIRSTATFIEL